MKITISTSHWVASTVAIITAFLCFVPNMLKMDIAPYAANISDMPLGSILQSLSLRYSLVASAAAMFPVIMQILFGMISGDPLSASYHDLIPKLFAILSILIPDLVFLLELCPSNNFQAVVPLFCARTIFLFASCLVFISSYPVHAWTPLWVNVIIGLFSAGEVLSSASAFAPSEKIYMMLFAMKLLCRIACVIVYVWRLYLWARYISGVKMETEDYVAALYLVVLITVSLGACVLNVIFSFENWHQRDANFFTGGIYASSILVTIFMLMNELIFKYEVSALQQSQVRAIKLILIGYFSHRMRSPLNTVAVGLAFVTKHFKKQLEGDMGDVVKEASSCCSLSIQILDNLLLYQKMDTGVVNMFPKKIYFKSFMKDAIEPFWVEVKDKAVVLIEEVVEDPLLDTGLMYILADSNRLTHVVRTILSNAVKFTKKRGRITVTVQYKSNFPTTQAVNALKGKTEAVGCISIKVTDTGCGIASDRLPGLFLESLYFKPGEDTSNKGSGLSLWISKRIIDSHKNGHLTVFSKGANSGSTFTITLPCYMSDQYEARKIEDDMVEEYNGPVDPEDEKMETYSQGSNRAISRADALAIEKKVSNHTDGNFRKLFGPNEPEEAAVGTGTGTGRRGSFGLLPEALGVINKPNYGVIKKVRSKLGSIYSVDTKNDDDDQLQFQQQIKLKLKLFGQNNANENHSLIILTTISHPIPLGLASSTYSCYAPATMRRIRRYSKSTTVSPKVDDDDSNPQDRKRRHRAQGNMRRQRQQAPV
eukprot:gene3526-7017_t